MDTNIAPYRLREDISKEADANLAHLPKFIRKLLFNRGIVDSEQAQNFLTPNYERDILDFALLKDNDRAAERIIKAIKANEKIIIFGDYDADGIPAAVVLHDFLKIIGYKNFANYFPHRFEEGYGLNISAIQEFKSNGVGLVITLDCGIADVAQVKKANELGIDVIITDHHSVQDNIPEAYAIVNPKREDCKYPYKMLCGSGVAFKLIQAIIAKKEFDFKAGAEKWLLDMVGLATLADMVPLDGENRALAHFGLKVLRKTPRTGFRALCRICGIDQSRINEDDIGFSIAPRINAASRIGHPQDAFQLLTSTNVEEAEMLAQKLEEMNNERKGTVAELIKEIKRLLLTRKKESGVLVVGNPRWKPALLGPVANNIMEVHQAPVFLWGRSDGDVIKGSCRSDGSVDLMELMREANEVFLTFGGHKLSGGFSVPHDKIHLLEERLDKAYEKLSMGREKREEELYIDDELRLDDVTWTIYNEIERLGPFGVGNPKPLFLFRNIAIDSVKTFGKEGNHLELQFRNSFGERVRAISFFTVVSDFGVDISSGKEINLLAHVEKSTFRNYPELRLRIVDIL